MPENQHNSTFKRHQEGSQGRAKSPVQSPPSPPRTEPQKGSSSSPASYFKVASKSTSNESSKHLLNNILNYSTIPSVPSPRDPALSKNSIDYLISPVNKPAQFMSPQELSTSNYTTSPFENAIGLSRPAPRVNSIEFHQACAQNKYYEPSNELKRRNSHHMGGQVTYPRPSQHNPVESSQAQYMREQHRLQQIRKNEMFKVGPPKTVPHHAPPTNYYAANATYPNPSLFTKQDHKSIQSSQAAKSIASKTSPLFEMPSEVQEKTSSDSQDNFELGPKKSIVKKQEKSLSCQFCNMKFGREYDLNRHEKTHGSSHIFKCHICQRVFTRKESLNKHVNKKVCLRKFGIIPDTKQNRDGH